MTIYKLLDDIFNKMNTTSKPAHKAFVGRRTPVSALVQARLCGRTFLTRLNPPAVLFTHRLGAIE